MRPNRPLMTISEHRRADCGSSMAQEMLELRVKIAKNDALIPAEEDVDGGSMVQVLVVAGGALPEVIEYDGNANVLLMWKVM